MLEPLAPLGESPAANHEALADGPLEHGPSAVMEQHPWRVVSGIPVPLDTFEAPEPSVDGNPAHLDKPVDGVAELLLAPQDEDLLPRVVEPESAKPTVLADALPPESLPAAPAAAIDLWGPEPGSLLIAEETTPVGPPAEPTVEEGPLAMVLEASEEPLDGAQPERPETRASVIPRANSNNRWLAPEIPTHAINEPEVLFTPNVGDVRVTFRGGEVFEGRLHSVGDHKVVLQTEFGSMGLESRRMVSVERLASTGVAQSGRGDGLGSVDPQTLPEVLVRTPGGVLRGRLIRREGRQVTLITQAGLQITIDSDDVREVRGAHVNVGLRRRAGGSQ